MAEPDYVGWPAEYNSPLKAKGSSLSQGEQAGAFVRIFRMTVDSARHSFL